MSELIMMREVVTPEMAMDWIAGSSRCRQRKLNPVRVNNYASDMGAGRWRLDADQPIRFDADGTYYDGQHRLAAVIKAGVPVEFWVLRGGSRELAMPSVDGPGVRTLGQVMELSTDFAHGADLAAALGWVWRYTHRADDGLLGLSSCLPSRSALIAFGNDYHPYLRSSVEFISGRLRTVPCGRSIGAFVHYMADFASGPGTTFFTSLITGADLPARSPILALRNRLTRKRGMHRDYIAAIVAKAYIMYASDSPCLLLRWSDAEGFPIFPGAAFTD